MTDATSVFKEALESEERSTIPTAQELADIMLAANRTGSADATMAALDCVGPSALIGILYQLEQMVKIHEKALAEGESRG